MAFDLNEFLNQGLIYGGARPSKFDIQLTLPPLLLAGTSSTIDPTSVQKLQFTCKASSIPAFIIGSIAVPYFGRKIKTAGDRVWQDWRITVMVDEDYATRALFEAWSNAINRIESNVMQANLDVEGYKGTWNITAYGKDRSVIREYQLLGGWPRTVGPMVLDWAATDRISEFECEISFDNMIPTVESTSKSSATQYGQSVDVVG